jgi:hypothetical protein
MFQEHATSYNITFLGSQFISSSDGRCVQTDGPCHFTAHIAGIGTCFIEWNRGMYQWISEGNNINNLFLKVNCFSNIVFLHCGCEFVLCGLKAFILSSTSQCLCCYAAPGKYLNSVQITSSGEE